MTKDRFTTDEIIEMVERLENNEVAAELQQFVLGSVQAMYNFCSSGKTCEDMLNNQFQLADYPDPFEKGCNAIYTIIQEYQINNGYV